MPKEEIAMINQAIKNNPANVFFYYELGKFHERMDNYDKALETYIRAIELNPNREEAYRQLGEFYSRHNKFDKALASFLKAVEIEPNNAQLHYLFGRFYKRSNHPEEALQEFLTAIRLEPDSPWFHYEIAEFYKTQGQYDKAQEELHLAIDRSSSPFEMSLMYNTLGSLYHETRNYKEAIATYNKAIMVVPSNIKEKMSLYWSLGHVYMENNQFEEAITEFKNALALDPKNVNLMRNLGRIYRNHGDYDEAIDIFMEALEYDSVRHSRSITYNAMGWAYYWKDMFDQAAKNLKEAIDLDPSSDEFNLDFTLALLRAGLVDSAYQHLSIFSKSLGKHHSRIPIINFYLGKITEKELLNKMSSKPGKCEAYYFLGMAYLLDFGKALSTSAPDTIKAKEFFENSLECGRHNYRLLTRTELSRLNVSNN
jgi:tetratricopeptide (TPR) repeat protein